MNERFWEISIYQAYRFYAFVQQMIALINELIV